MELTDEDLVRRVRSGDSASFAVLVERHYPRCLRYGLRMLGDRSDAEEAVQDAFVRAHRSLDRYEDRQAFGAWLFRILVNRCRTAGARRARREETFVRFDSVDEGDFGGHHDGYGTEVQVALMQLDEPSREALLLKYVEEWGYDDISALTGDGVSALKMRVKRARERLRELLTGET